jgi:hypothetical protein
MNVFSSFFDEVCAMEPNVEHSQLAEVLHNIEVNDDEIAIELFDKIRWVISQTDEPVMVRLLMIERLMAKFVAEH